MEVAHWPSNTLGQKRQAPFQLAPHWLVSHMARHWEAHSSVVPGSLLSHVQRTLLILTTLSDEF